MPDSPSRWPFRSSQVCALVARGPAAAGCDVVPFVSARLRPFRPICFPCTPLPSVATLIGLVSVLQARCNVDRGIIGDRWRDISGDRSAKMLCPGCRVSASQPCGRSQWRLVSFHHWRVPLELIGGLPPMGRSMATVSARPPLSLLRESCPWRPRPPWRPTFALLPRQCLELDRS